MDRIEELHVAAEEDPAEVYDIAVTAFEAFYAHHYEQVVRMALALSRDIGAAEDLAQDAFLAARQDWGRIAHYERPEMWVRRAVANRSASRFRRLVREGRALARLGQRADRWIEASDPSARVWAAIAALPPRQAQVVVLAVMEDLHPDDVAEILGCGSETVRTHLRRARSRLAEVLREENE